MQNTGYTTKLSAPETERKLLFIVNPNAGKKISDRIIQIITREFPKNIHYHVVIWENRHRFDDITALLKTQGYTDAIAVGGDGTVNQVAKAILGTSITLGIVPIGSGNGLARSLGLSIEVEEVVKQIATGKKTKIDSGLVNGMPFFCTSGIGFDAHIGNLFASSKKRGLPSYVKITVRELLRYRAKNYVLKFNGREIKRKAFLITAANAGQYGNDFYIAPQASLRDGLFHVAILKPFNVLKVFGILYNIFRRKANFSSSIETYSADRITIVREHEDTIHYDGEPTLQPPEVVFENKPRSLNVIVGEKFSA